MVRLNRNIRSVRVDVRLITAGFSSPAFQPLKKWDCTNFDAHRAESKTLQLQSISRTNKPYSSPLPMQLQCRAIPDWPKTAWCARASSVDVLCGPKVESQDGWIFERTWAGKFISICMTIWSTRTDASARRNVLNPLRSSQTLKPIDLASKKLWLL